MPNYLKYTCMQQIKKIFLLACLCLAMNNTAVAQEKQVQNVQQTWLAYFNQSRLSEHWGLWLDMHLRTKDDFLQDEFSTGLIRAGVTYFANENLRFTAGYAFVNHFPTDAHKNISQPEHRPWQQVQWLTKYPKLRLTQALRLEQRFRRKILNDDELAGGYHFNHRLRYNFLMAIPLSKQGFQPKTLSLVMNDEVHINFGEEIVYNTFDHNRFFVGFNYQLSPQAGLQFGYMNFFQQTAAGNRYRSIHTARIFFQHSMDFRKKEAEGKG